MLSFTTRGNFIDFKYTEDVYPNQVHLVLTLHNSSKCISWGYGENATHIDFKIDDITYNEIPITSIYFDGVVMSAQADFKTKIEGMFPGLANGGGGGSSYLVASVELTDAQIKALPSTPVQILAAPPAGKAYLFLGGAIVLDASLGQYTNVSSFEDNIAGITAMFSTGFGVMGYERCADTFANVGIWGVQLAPASGRIYSPTDIEVTDGAAVAYTQDSFDGLLDGAMTINIDNYTAGYAVDLGNFTGGNAANTLKVTVYYVVVDL